ncbi:MAG: hypothetical protein EPO31_13795 [Gammaproteobacteria bacterium]|nr:MAG: hypothetical protein EPO31_13795 [Gammaproteobacteria bacterium]
MTVRPQRILSWLIVSAFLLSGCNNSLSLKTAIEVPEPQVAKLPLTVGVYYEDELKNHVYTEDSEDRPGWKIDTGESQVELFDRILPAMFQTVTQVAQPTSGGGLDAVLAPHVEDMQFALPRETGTDLYEAWIKYRLSLYDQAGVAIANWTISGYGKSTPEFLGRRDEGLQQAINAAFRDAGARLALSFTRNEEVKKWLSEKLGE